MSETSLNQVSHDLISPVHINDSTCQTVAAGDQPATPDVAQCYSFRVARLKSDRRPRSNVETFSICFCTIEQQRRVGLDEVIVRTDLSARPSSSRIREKE